MSDCLEVLFLSDTSGSVQCLDPRIGTVFVNYRGSTGIKNGCLDVINGSYLLGAEETKPILNIWPLNSQETVAGPKLVLPGRVSALACSPDGIFCVVAIDTKIYVYLMSSGALLGVLSKHYRGITKLLFLSDSAHFVSCAENGSVFVWRVATAVAQEGTTILDKTIGQEPLYNFSHHALRITDAYAGPAGLAGRLYTASIDQTAKIYDLKNGNLLLSLTLDEAITSIRPNIIETRIYFGTGKGDIIEYALDPWPRTLDHTVREPDIPDRLQEHDKAVTSLTISQDGFLLISAGADGKVIVWDLPSRQQLKLYGFKTAISSAILTLAFDNIFSEKFVPNSIFKNFQRVSQEGASFEVNVMVNQTLEPIDYSKKGSTEILVQGDNSDEMDRLKSQLAEAQLKNKELYQFAMEKILKNPYDYGKPTESKQPVKRKKKHQNGST